MNIRYTYGEDWHAQENTVYIPCRLSPCPDDIICLLSPAQQANKTWSRTDLYKLLHEQGHIHYKHVPQANPIMALACEVAAWRYAADCIRPEYRAEMWALAQQCLKTYQ